MKNANKRWSMVRVGRCKKEETGRKGGAKYGKKGAEMRMGMATFIFLGELRAKMEETTHFSLSRSRKARKNGARASAQGKGKGRRRPGRQEASRTGEGNRRAGTTTKDGMGWDGG
jgi:hypothetical protein